MSTYTLGWKDNTGKKHTKTYANLAELYADWPEVEARNNVEVSVDGKLLATFEHIEPGMYSIFYQAAREKNLVLMNALEKDHQDLSANPILAEDNAMIEAPDLLTQEEKMDAIARATFDFSRREDVEKNPSTEELNNQGKVFSALIRHGANLPDGFIEKNGSQQDVAKTLATQMTENPSSHSGKQIAQYISIAPKEKVTQVLGALAVSTDLELRLYLIKEAGRIEKSTFVGGGPEKAQKLRAMAVNKDSIPQEMIKELAKKRPTYSWLPNSEQTASIKNMPEELRKNYETEVNIATGQSTEVRAESPHPRK